MGDTGIKPKFSVEKAHKAQLYLSHRIIFEDKLPRKIRFVAGVDVAYVNGMSIGAVAVLDYDSLRLIESQVALCKTSFPYVPTLLSFREIPSAVLCARKLKTQPDVYLIDGQGFAHPYRCGFASHLGLVIRKPTIGVAKSRLFGEVESAEIEKDVAFLRHKNEVVGAVVTTKRGCKPVYVSVGHMVSLKTAIKIVKHCTRNHCIPEPILKAHEIAATEKRKIHIVSATTKEQ
ncbi:MAG: endonuclease V [Candidatus Bathyarchaeota archaeon]|nr:endonuclease V [Candidatus Bathyarchaeota archaeon]